MYMEEKSSGNNYSHTSLRKSPQLTGIWQGVRDSIIVACSAPTLSQGPAHGYSWWHQTCVVDPRRSVSCLCLTAESRRVPVLGPGAGDGGTVGSGGTQQSWMSCPGWRRQEHTNTGCNSASHRFRIGHYCGTGTRAMALALVPPTTAANELWQ